MAQGTTPVEQRRLRNELRRIREDRRRTQKTVAEALGWSVSKVLRLESGATIMSTSDLMALLHYYKIDDDHSEQLLAITRGQTKEAWWNKYSSVYTQQFLNYLGYEDSALQVRQFSGLVVPGVLQTEGYMRALFAGYMETGEAVDRGVEVRLQRQETLTRANSPDARFVIDEAVLHRWVGSPNTMVEQLMRLKELAERPDISIQVVPFAAGVHRGMLGSFTIFGFSSETEDYVVALDDPNQVVLIKDDAEITTRYLEIFGELTGTIASPPEDFNKIIDRMIDKISKTMND